MSSVAIAAVCVNTPPARAQKVAPAQLEVIVVTAQKRRENIQKTPLTVIAVSAQQLQAKHVISPDELAGLVQGLQVQGSGNTTVFVIRGIGSGVNGPTTQQGTSTNLDGVNVGQVSSPEAYLFDIRSVEVAEGPQGTLYGRGALGGVISFVSNKPTAQFSGGTTLSLGNYNDIRSDTFVNLPLSDVLFSRISVVTENHSGYENNGFDDADQVGARLQLLYKPTDALSLRVYGGYFERGGRGEAPIDLPVKGNGWNDVAFPPNQQQKILNLSVGAELNYDFGFANLTWLPSYTNAEQHYNNAYFVGNDSPFFWNNNGFHQEEVRLSSEADSKLKWTVGGYYYHNSDEVYLDTKITIPHGPVIFPVTAYPTLGSEGEAVFGQVTYPVLRWLRLTAGYRYHRDDDSEIGRDYQLPLTPQTQVLQYGGNKDFSGTNYRLGFDADLTPHALFYFTTGSGYSPGGFNPGESPTSSGVYTYNASTVTHYEVGLKSEWFNNRLRANLALYDDEYKNYDQGGIARIYPLALRDNGFVTLNAGSARLRGVEVSLNYRPTAYDKLSFSGDYTDDRFGMFVSPIGGNYSGFPIPFTAHFSGNFSYEHDWMLVSGATISAVGQSQFTGGYATEYTDSSIFHQRGYHETALSVQYTTASGKYGIQGYVKNLENQLVFESTMPTGGGAFAQLNAPRTFGGGISAKF